MIVRAYVYDAKRCYLVDVVNDNNRYELKRLTKDGLYEGVIEDRNEVFQYRLRIERFNGEIRQFMTPTVFCPHFLTMMSFSSARAVTTLCITKWDRSYETSMGSKASLSQFGRRMLSEFLWSAISTIGMVAIMRCVASVHLVSGSVSFPVSNLG